MVPRPPTGKTPVRNLRVADRLWKAAQEKADAESRTLTDVITAYLRRYVSTPARSPGGRQAAPPAPPRSAAERAAGYPVTARCQLTHGDTALIELPGEELPTRWPAADIAAQAGIAARDLPGARLELTVREAPEEGRVLSGFRLAADAGRDVLVRCLLLFGDQAELVPEGGDEEDAARWPAAAIAADTGLEPGDLPGRLFRARVLESEGRVSFSGFRAEG